MLTTRPLHCRPITLKVKMSGLFTYIVILSDGYFRKGYVLPDKASYARLEGTANPRKPGQKPHSLVLTVWYNILPITSKRKLTCMSKFNNTTYLGILIISMCSINSCWWSLSLSHVSYCLNMIFSELRMWPILKKQTPMTYIIPSPLQFTLLFQYKTT